MPHHLLQERGFHSFCPPFAKRPPQIVSRREFLLASLLVSFDDHTGFPPQFCNDLSNLVSGS